MTSTRPCVLMDSMSDENTEWGVRREYVDQFRDYFDIVWSRDVEKNPELGKKVREIESAKVARVPAMSTFTSGRIELCSYLCLKKSLRDTGKALTWFLKKT